MITTLRNLRVFLAFSFCIFYSMNASASKAETIYTYNIDIAAEHRTKELLTIVTDQLEVTHRYITTTGFSFKSKHDYPNEVIESVFTMNGVSNIIITKFGEKLPVFQDEKVGGTDCDFAEILCSNGSLAGNSAGYGTQELNGSNRGCLTGNEHQSSWYYLNVQTGGTLGMLIDPNVNTDDYDFAIWGPFTAANAGANCPPTTNPIRCSFSAQDDVTGLATMNLGTPSGCGFLGLFSCPPSAVTDNSENSGGDAFVNILNVSANEIYILLVDNFTASSNPYSMSFTGSAILGCTPVILPVEVKNFSGKGVNKSSLIEFSTESELNNDYFIVEWSTNPKNNNWTMIETVYSKGDSDTEQAYSVFHDNPDATTVNYYRLVQVDKNGEQRVYSKMVQVGFNGTYKVPAKVFNLLGQEVDQNYSGIVVYVYEDGTSEKVINP